MAPQLTPAEIRRICELYAQCGNYSTVAQLVGRSSASVAKYVKQAEKERSAANA